VLHCQFFGVAFTQHNDFAHEFSRRS